MLIICRYIARCSSTCSSTSREPSKRHSNLSKQLSPAVQCGNWPFCVSRKDSQKQKKKREIRSAKCRHTRNDMRGESKGISRGLSAYADRNLTKFVATTTSNKHLLCSSAHGTVVTPWSSIWIWTKGKRRWKICRALHVYLCFPVLAAVLPMTDGQLVSHINHRALHSTVSSSVSQSLWQSVWQSLSKPKQIWQFTVVVVGISNFNPPSDSIWGLLARPRPLRMPLPLSLPLAVPCPALPCPALDWVLGTVCALILLWSSVAAAVNAQWCKL